MTDLDFCTGDDCQCQAHYPSPGTFVLAVLTTDGPAILGFSRDVPMESALFCLALDVRESGRTLAGQDVAVIVPDREGSGRGWVLDQREVCPR